MKEKPKEKPRYIYDPVHGPVERSASGKR